MQVLCVASEEAEAAIACPVCGQQYEVFYSRSVAAECEAALLMVKKALEEHHRDATPGNNAHENGREAARLGGWAGARAAGGRTENRATATPAAHPGLAFNVPAWHGEPYASGAALLGGAKPRPVAAERVVLEPEATPAKPVSL